MLISLMMVLFITRLVSSKNTETSHISMSRDFSIMPEIRTMNTAKMIYLTSLFGNDIVQRTEQIFGKAISRYKEKKYHSNEDQVGT